MPLSAYGTTNPRGLEPWQIESTLAPLAVGGSQAEAQSMLENYQQQREAAANVYGADLDQQHQYAYDQLRQQMAENYLKAIPENAKAGTLGILASGYPQAFAGADPNVVNSVIGQQTRLQNADIAQKGGAGVWSLTNAGMAPTQADTQNLTGLNVTPGTPIPISVAQLKLQGDLARANASAANAGPRVSTDIPNAYGGKSTVSFPARMGDIAQDAWMRSHGMVPTDAPPPNQPLPGTATAPQSPPPRTNLPNLPMAKTDTPANNAPTTPTKNTAAGAAAARQVVLANLDKLQATHPDIYTDVKAGMAKNGGAPMMAPDGKGGWLVVGASGKTY
jgi:hypothetical protein